jgi:HPr kinase/phosphorylase
MQVHASCAARDGAGVLLLGPPGAGKSDMVLRLLDHGFVLVADDRVEIAGNFARPADGLAGLLEVRGLGILRLPHVSAVRLQLAVSLGSSQNRLPAPARYECPDIPLLAVDPTRVSAANVIAMALDCALGRVAQVAGAFA